LQLQYENDRATLIISEAFLKDAGVYIITAKNLAGEASSSCNVCVKGRLPNETSDSELASDMEPIKPSVQLPLKDFSVFEGKSVRLDCVIVGQPEPEVIWYHNNRPVKESTDFQLLFQGDRCSLLIQEAYLEDAGHYKVVAINSAGEASSQCQLAITPLNVAEPATRTPIDRILPCGTAPRFEKLLSDILVPEGDVVEFDCKVIGDPRPSIKWFLNNKDIDDNLRYKIISQNDGVAKLIIENVCPDDKGVYTVKASNSFGEAKCFSHLIVKSVNISDINRPVQIEIEEKVICPSFKELFSDKIAHLDDSVKFECIVIGKPTPKIKWFFNDEPVHGKDFLVSTSGNRQVLTIPTVSNETIGKVSCIAENDVGKATCVAYLKMPSDLTMPSISSQSMIQEHNTDSSTVTIKKQVFTSTSSTHTSTVENGNLPQTQIHTIKTNMDHSFKQSGEQSPEIIQSKQYQEYRQSNDLPSTVQQKTVVSMTKNIQDNKNFIIKPTRKSIAPRFMSPLVGKIVDQGSDVTLEAIVDGYPVPEIKITKNGEELKETDKIIIQNYLNKITIQLLNVNVRDAGRYACVANNIAGTSTSTADVVVKSNYFIYIFF